MTDEYTEAPYLSFSEVMLYVGYDRETCRDIVDYAGLPRSHISRRALDAVLDRNVAALARWKPHYGRSVRSVLDYHAGRRMTESQKLARTARLAPGG